MDTIKPKIKAVKRSDTELEITKQAPQPTPVTQTYDRDFIEQQIIDITAQRDEMIALKEAELAECQSILDEMDKQGIVSKLSTKEVLPEEEKMF